MERRELFKNKYRVKTCRYTKYDYSDDAAYFITICSKDRIPWFGEVHNRIMRLSDMGCDVHQCWNGIPQHFPFVILDSFIVMPDHVHGILIINKHLPPVETRHGASLREPINQFGPLQIQSLQLVVNQFKSACTRRIRQFFPEFRWQSRFYDRIIRDDRGMDRIRDYIECNPIIDPVGCHVSEMKKPTSKID